MGNKIINLGITNESPTKSLRTPNEVYIDVGMSSAKGKISNPQIYESENKNIVIKAPAGSGKTSSLLTAIADYRYKYLNDRICAITYTRAARAEMESRLQELGIFDVEVSTIHV